MRIEEIEHQAKLLARENRKADPDILHVWWFPNEQEVRLVELHQTVPPADDGKIHPYFFRPSPIDGLPAPSGVALISPSDFRQAQLPQNWGTWDDAKELETEE